VDDAVGLGVDGVDFGRAGLVGVAPDGGGGDFFEHRLGDGRQRASDGVGGGGVVVVLYEGDFIWSGVLGALVVGCCPGDFAVACFVVDSLHPGRGDGRCGAGVGRAVATGIGEVVVGVGGF
jgi:hypothetical protein